MRKYTGGCQCGHIRYSLSGEPTSPHFCHCRMCQRLAGAPIVAWVDFPISSLKYEGAEPSLYQSSENTQRGFCPKCGSSIFALDDGGECICVTIATLDHPEFITPEYETYKESSPPWMNLDSLDVANQER